MYQVILHLFSLRSRLSLPHPVQLQLAKPNWHFTLSPLFKLCQHQQLQQHLHFHLRENDPTFHLCLALHPQDLPTKLLGQVEIDVREWPLAVEKRRKIRLHPDVQVELSVKVIYLTSYLGDASTLSQGTADRQSLQHAAEAAREKHRQLHQTTHLLRQHAQLLAENNQQIASQISLKKSHLLAVAAERQQKTEQLGRQNRQLAVELEAANLKLQLLVNLVSEFGEGKVCSQVADLLGGDAEAATSAPSSF